MKNFILGACMLGAALTADAQVLNAYKPAGHVTVAMGVHMMSAPFAGGFNVPQFSMADLNGDGKLDLVSFEGYGKKGVRTFINQGLPGAPDYRYAPQYERSFPEIFNYMILADYNRDGVSDLFHAGLTGFYIFKGYYSNGMLQFNFVKELRYGGPNGQANNAYVDNTCVPGIIDVDGDGDLDFFAYSISGMRILFYKNIQEEYGLPRDTIRVQVASGCWASTLQPADRTNLLGVDQSICDTNYMVPPAPPPHPGSGASLPAEAAKGQMHGTNTLCMMDIDGDGDVDYLNGNGAFNDLQFLQNGRVQYNWFRDTIIAQDTLWQSNGKMYYQNSYPAAFHIDYNGDGKKDIVIAPHGAGSRNRSQIWYYQNNGTATAPHFVFTTDSLFAKEVIDLGRDSHPLFYDFNKDGKPDLLIGGLEKRATGQDISRLYYYENTTTIVGQPQFRYVTNDLAGLSGLSVYATSPAVGDVDGDGKDDLLVGRADGKIIYFRNTAASPNDPPVWVLEDLVLTRDGADPLNVWSSASPAFYDINKDGKSDLVIGQADGTLTAYLNTNTASGTVSFGMPIDTFGGVRVPDYDTSGGNTPFPIRYSTPFIGKIQEGSSKDYLLMGGIYGRLYVWDSVGTGNVNQVFPMIADTFSALNLQANTAPAVADIDGDGKLEMVVGTEMGGLLLYWTGTALGTGPAIQTAARSGFRLYPNPAKNAFSVDVSGIGNRSGVALTATDLSGRIVLREVWPAGKILGNVEVQGWPAGTYLLSVVGEAGVETQKIQVLP